MTYKYCPECDDVRDTKVDPHSFGRSIMFKEPLRNTTINGLPCYDIAFERKVRCLACGEIWFTYELDQRFVLNSLLEKRKMSEQLKEQRKLIEELKNSLVELTLEYEQKRGELRELKNALRVIMKHVELEEV